jgi:hypothetical protein
MATQAYAQTTYVVQISLVFLWALSILISDPLNYRGKQLHKQRLVPTKLWLTRLKDPLKEKIPWHHLEDSEKSMPQFTLTHNVIGKQDTFDSIVYKFLNEHTFTEEDNFDTLEGISINLMSPHTRAMVIMGCYGDPLRITEMKNPAVIRMAYNHSTAFMLNIMLQTWEDEHNNYDRKQAGVGEIAHFSNDRSACSCMKDFANPAVLKSKTGMHDEKYKYDSCLMQNLVDYTAAPDMKQRPDPMKSELQTYTNMLTKYYTKQNNTAIWRNVSIEEAMKTHPEINMLISIIGNTSVLNLQDLMDHLDARISVMYPHNKLRTPNVHISGDSEEGLSKYPPSVTTETFTLYMKKYRSAFQVCAHNGVPKYQTKQLVLLEATKFGKLGMSFLLGAAMIGFSVLYKKMQCDDQKEQDNTVAKIGTFVTSTVLKWAVIVLEFITRVVIIASIATALYSISTDIGDKSAVEKMTILTFTTALWWVFASVLIVNFGVETWKVLNSKCEEQTYVRSQISQDVCVIGGLANIGVSLLLHRGESDEYVVTACFVLFLTIGLIQHCSNLVRMMQLYVANMLAKSTKTLKANIGIAYNRVLVLVLVAVGLLGYVMLASSSLQTLTVDVLYGYQRVRIFAICAFLIFSTFDIFFEVLVVMKYGDVASFREQHPRKMMWTGWVIIVSLLILELHQYTALCTGSDPAALEDVCNIFHYFFKAESVATPSS